MYVTLILKYQKGKSSLLVILEQMLRFQCKIRKSCLNKWYQIKYWRLHNVDLWIELSVFYNIVNFMLRVLWVLTVVSFMTVYFNVNSLIYNNVYIYHKTFARRLTLYTTFQSHAWNLTYLVSEMNFKISLSYLGFKKVICDKNTNSV